MKKFPIIIVLILSFTWFYASWYWYVCNIRDLCGTGNLEQNSTLDTLSQELPQAISQGTGSSQQLAQVQDILETQIVTLSTQTGQATAEDTPQNASLVKVSCDDIITQTISLGGKNNDREVENLESFLNTQGENLNVDGKYEQEDYEAVKRFQLTYKQEILTPAGISNPTGLVYKNTMKKINQIHCQ